MSRKRPGIWRKWPRPSKIKLPSVKFSNSATMDGASLSDDCMDTDPVSITASCTTDLVRSLASLSVVNVTAKNLGGIRGERAKWYSGRREIVETMDKELWSNLPEHLHDIILAWLPLPSFFRLRCVCKRWNEIITSKNFLSICSRVPSQGSLFLMFADMLQQKCAAYDPTSQRWHLLPPSFFLPCPYFESFVVVASSGGLLCLEGTGSQNRYYSVSNPMTRTQRKLPAMLHMKSPNVVGMVMDREQRTYKILVVQDGESSTSQVYDSKSNLWYMTSSLPSRVAHITGTAFMNGYLYCMSFGAGTGVLAFDVNRGSWHEVKVKMPMALVCPQLIGHRGQLMMVGGLEEYGGMLRSVHLWRLDMTRKEWVEVRCMPETLFNKLFKSQCHQFLCVSHGDYICFTELSSREMLMYDMYRNSWWWLPVCTLNNNLEARGVGFSFEPRLDALV